MIYFVRSTYRWYLHNSRGTTDRLFNPIIDVDVHLSSQLYKIYNNNNNYYYYYYYSYLVLVMPNMS